MKKKSFIRNLVRFMIPLLIPMIILGGFSIVITQSYIKDQINTSNTKMLEQTRSTVEMMFNEMDSLHYTINLNSNLISSLKSILRSENINRGDLGAYSTFMNLLNPFSNIKTYVYSIYLYFDNEKGNFLASNEGMVSKGSFYDNGWYDRLPLIGSEELFMENRSVRRFSFDQNTTELVTIYRKFQSPGSTRTVGHIVMNIKRNVLDNRLRELRYLPHQSIYLLNQDGVPIASTVNDTQSTRTEESLSLLEVYREEVSNKENIVTVISSSKYPVRYVSITPKVYFYSLPIRLLYLTFGLLGLSLLLGITLAYYISKQNKQNLDTVMLTLDNAEKGLQIPELPHKVTDEYSYILQGIVKSFVEQSYLKIQLSEKKYRLKTMEMIALQSNINPHFMANTLRTIFWKSMDLTGGQNDVSQMLDYLAGIVHYSITDSNKTVLLEEEIFHTNNYVEILKIRYKGKFSFQWDYDEELIHNKIMKLILQPLVENAVYHGIKESDRFGYIRVKIVQMDQLLRITITDTGIGMKRERLKELRESLNTDEQRNHIGLFNTYKRLQLMYGEEQTFTIRSIHGLGTMVEIVIPAAGEYTNSPNLVV